MCPVRARARRAAETADRLNTGQLYALRLTTPAGPLGLQGEIEHVVSGECLRFGGTAELLAWLKARQPAAAQREPAAVVGPPPRRATT